MALAAATVWEIRTAGAATNGGGFVTGAAGTDYSQQDAKNTVGNNISTTDAVAVGTGVITSATATFTSAIVGNIIYLQGGTGALAAGWYQVTVFTSGTSITVDRNVAAGTGITMNIGGAHSDPALVASVVVAGNTIWQKAGTYSITSASTNVAGGCVTFAVRYYWEGYQTTRGDLGTKPVIQASGISTATLFATQTSGNAFIVRNVVVDGAGLTALRGWGGSGGGTLDLCVALNCTNNGFNTGSCTLNRCLGTGCSTQPVFASAARHVACVAHDNTVTAFSAGGGQYVRCIADTNTGASSDGFAAMQGGVCMNCVAYANGRAGFRPTANVANVYINCISEANGTFGFDTFAGTETVLLYNATFNNTSGALNAAVRIEVGSVAGSSSFFTNAASGDFSLNSTVGGGAAVRAAGIPGVFPGGLTTGYIDIGAAQHGDPVGGGSAVAIFGG